MYKKLYTRRRRIIFLEKTKNNISLKNKNNLYSINCSKFKFQTFLNKHLQNYHLLRFFRI